jgi:hypothetical protein
VTADELEYRQAGARHGRRRSEAAPAVKSRQLQAWSPAGLTVPAEQHIECGLPALAGVL